MQMSTKSRALIVGCLILAGGCLAEELPAETETSELSASPSALPASYPFWALQLNLCNSGFAGCYEGGKSVPEAVTAIRNSAPDVVTLNEICENDLPTLRDALAGVYVGATVVAGFQPAIDKRNGGPYKCKNGFSYGIGIVAHIPSPYTGHTFTGGAYPMQDATSNEHRAWLCLAATGNYYACTTHLTHVSGTVALNQCKHLMNTVIPSVRAAGGGYRPTVVGADLNLKYGGSPNAQSCVPSGYYRKGDGSVQHIMATSDLAFVSSRKIGLSYSDHDGWFVSMTAP